jgi:four helix bundle protein
LVCANLAEALRKRRYPKNIISKLSDSEAPETQVWLDFTLSLDYINLKTFESLNDKYEHIIAMLINMSNQKNGNFNIDDTLKRRYDGTKRSKRKL